MRIAVVDLEIGNLRSVEQALLAVSEGAQIQITRDPKEILDCDKLVLPGQGAIGTWFEYFNRFDLRESVQHAFENKPVLGICVGMQAMFARSAEDGGLTGLGLFDGTVEHFSQFHSADDQGLKIPQMGWNRVKQSNSHPLWHDIDDEAYFYFVHSYCANLNQGADREVVLGETNYGHQFVSAVGRDNVFAVQFHPEKSQDDGLQLLKNFCQWNGEV